MRKLCILVVMLAGCSPEKRTEEKATHTKDSVVVDTLEKSASLPEIRINDSLDAIAQLIAGKYPSGRMFTTITGNEYYIDFSESFSKRWLNFDSSRIMKLAEFRSKELTKEIKAEPNVFYPFSGPDFLYANLFFPEADKFVLIGLEPVGTLPEFSLLEGDSLKRYYTRLNSSLNAILKFSFFRTESMSRDLRNGEVDGTIHLLFLFLSRTGNSIVSARPVTIDSSGKKSYVSSFDALKMSKLKSKGVEILFRTPGNKLKELNYYSLNVVDQALKDNPGYVTYLKDFKNFNTYLKGASYLLHKPYFSIVRNVILQGSTTVVQDDSGIAFRYFLDDTHAWNYKLYGQYSKPIRMFSKHYQPLLDSMYKEQGANEFAFGLGYNYRDKNSNFMIVTKKN